MKALFLAATAALIAATAPASASILSIGNSLARGCYVAALVMSAEREGLNVCNRALAEQPLSPEDLVATHVNRGILRMFSGDERGAERDFLDAIARDPRQAEAWLNFGVLRYRQGNSAEAVGLFDRAIALGTRAPAIAYFGRGLAQEEQGNLKAAYADLLRARSLRPEWDRPAQELARYQVRRRGGS